MSAEAGRSGKGRQSRPSGTGAILTASAWKGAMVDAQWAETSAERTEAYRALLEHDRALREAASKIELHGESLIGQITIASYHAVMWRKDGVVIRGDDWELVELQAAKLADEFAAAAKAAK